MRQMGLYSGSIFDAIEKTDAKIAIICTVNCEGFLGKGLALEFALRYSDYNEHYKKLCEELNMKIGDIDVFTCQNGQEIITFPTKNKFKFPSKMDYIQKGMESLIKANILSNTVAMPALGCGLGGLNIDEVYKLVEESTKHWDHNIYFCTSTFSPQEHTKEFNMVNDFKYVVETKALSNLKKLDGKKLLNNSQIEAIENYIYIDNIKHFHDISRIDKIGKVTFKNLHEHFYNKYNI